MTKLNFKRVSAFLAFIFMAYGSWAQFSVTGTVTEKNGEPMVGVSISVKNSTFGTISGVDGTYMIDNIPGESNILIFSFVGYKTLELEVSTSKTTLDVSMQLAETNLDEVVITGLASSIKRSNLANSVSTISSNELMGITPPQTMDAALYGKFTGAVISANSGSPGGGISVKLRGVTSINGVSQPLYIVDGVYIDNSSIAAELNVVSAASSGSSSSNQDNASNRIADINPDDIETIEILKGASASAIYGSRASAGVIIITTKKGIAGKTKVNFSQSLGFNTILNPLGVRKWDADKAEVSFGLSGRDAFIAAESSGKIYNYEEEFFGNKGLISNTRISASGGNQKTQVYSSITYKNEEGIVKHTGYEKFSIRLNMDQKISDKISLSVTSNYINSLANRGYFGNDNSGSTLGISYIMTPPWAELHADENGNYPNNPYGYNFLQTRDLMTNNEQVSRIISGANLTSYLYTTNTSSLKFIVNAGIDHYTLRTNAIFPRELQFEKDGNGTNGASILGTTVVTNNNMSAFLVHSYFPSSELSFHTQIGITREQFERNTVVVTATEMIGSQTNVDQSGSVSVVQFRSMQKDMGFFAQEEINFKDRILATLGIRGDKSSNNGDVNKLYFYPKASLALNIHEFDFWTVTPINQLKLRVAYGQSGGFAQFGSAFTSLGNTIIAGNAGLIINTLRGNSEVGPERQAETEAGIDIGFMNGLAALDFTVYKKRVTDLLLNADVPLSSGYTEKVTNAADLENKGIEIGLNLRPIQTKDLRWNFKTSFWMNRSKVTRLDIPAYNLGAFAPSLGIFRIQEGYSATMIVGNGPGPADKDTLDNGLVIWGDAEPDFQMSLLSSLQYKGFEFSFLFHWKKGGENINLSTLLGDIFGNSHDYDDMTLDPDGAMSDGPFRLNSPSAEPWIQDASYLRLREIGIFYRVPKDKLGKYISGLRVGLSGHNILNFFTYNSYDPEVSNFGSGGISTGVEVTPFPSSKSYFVHLSLSF